MKTEPGNLVWPLLAMTLFIIYILGLVACDRLIGHRNGVTDVNEYWPQNWPVFGSWITFVVLLWHPHRTPQLRQK